MISVDQGGTAVPFDRVTRSDRELELEIEGLEFTYRGKFSDDAQSIQGSMTQFGRNFPLALARAKPLGKLSHLESWQGTMQAGPKTFEFQIRMMQAEDGTRVGQFDSLSEHLADLRLELDVAGSDFRFKLPVTQAAFAGTLNESKTQISGHWLQSGQRFPLTFTKVDLADTKHVEPPRRPQTPKAPFPYEACEVEFENAADQVRLAGTLTMPRGAGRIPQRFWFPARDPEDRDESLLDHKPFFVLADHLTAPGLPCCDTTIVAPANRPESSVRRPRWTLPATRRPPWTSPATGDRARTSRLHRAQ